MGGITNRLIKDPETTDDVDIMSIILGSSGLDKLDSIKTLGKKSTINMDRNILSSSLGTRALQIPLAARYSTTKEKE